MCSLISTDLVLDLGQIRGYNSPTSWLFEFFLSQWIPSRTSLNRYVIDTSFCHILEVIPVFVTDFIGLYLFYLIVAQQHVYTIMFYTSYPFDPYMTCPYSSSGQKYIESMGVPIFSFWQTLDVCFGSLSCRKRKLRRSPMLAAVAFRLFSFVRITTKNHDFLFLKRKIRGTCSILISPSGGILFRQSVKWNYGGAYDGAEGTALSLKIVTLYYSRVLLINLIG